ncbi:hypothetical protein M0657_001404 [Pyricularia oryzae]|nr:hypothetical protein M9X92_005693 [Pyricularia oryzae]KAI7931042.1 hypothetical protein M0657_001404 [Pyricularia oryzae]
MAPSKSGEAGRILVSISPRLIDAADTYQPRALAKIFKKVLGRSDGDRTQIAQRSDRDRTGIPQRSNGKAAWRQIVSYVVS